MEFNVKRNNKYIEKLTKTIEENYNIIINNITTGSRGCEAETWIIDTDKKRYFAKIIFFDNQLRNFKKSLNIIKYFNNKGITNVNILVSTVDNEVYMEFNSGVLALYEFIEGEVDYNYPFNKIMKLLIPIYKLEANIDIDKEDFNVESLIKKLCRYSILLDDNSLLKKCIDNYNDKISLYIDKLMYYDNIIDKNIPLFITHGDICQNIMISDPVRIIDWDDVLLAPIERDCWFFADNNEKIIKINKILLDNGINYKLNKDLLCYYAYKNSLIYLYNNIRKYLQIEEKDILNDIKDIFEGWISFKINLLEVLDEKDFS